MEGARFTAAEAMFVERLRTAHLATVRPDGIPHVIPVSPVLDLDRLVFATETETQKVRNIRSNPAVAVCFDEYTEVWSALKQVVVFGRAFLIETGFEFQRNRDLLYRKYAQYEVDSPIEERTSVMVEIQVQRVASWGLDRS